MIEQLSEYVVCVCKILSFFIIVCTCRVFWLHMVTLMGRSTVNIFITSIYRCSYTKTGIFQERVHLPLPLNNLLKLLASQFDEQLVKLFDQFMTRFASNGLGNSLA